MSNLLDLKDLLKLAIDDLASAIALGEIESIQKTASIADQRLADVCLFASRKIHEVAKDEIYSTVNDVQFAAEEYFDLDSLSDYAKRACEAIDEATPCEPDYPVTERLSASQLGVGRWA